MRSNNNIHDATNFPDIRALAKAKPAGTPTIMANTVDRPAVMNELNNALGKSDRVILKKLSSVKANGLSQIGSKIANGVRNDSIRTHNVGIAANINNAIIMVKPKPRLMRNSVLLSIMMSPAGSTWRRKS